MGKIGRNDSCPCGSGKKYKKCCLNRPQNISETRSDFYADIIDYDELSNSINDLLKESNFEKALAVCGELLKKYPEQIDGISRFAQVYEAMEDRVKAAKYYRKSAEFAATHEGFEQVAVDMYLEDAMRMESEE